MKKWWFAPLFLLLLSGCSYFADTSFEDYIASKMYDTDASIKIHEEFIGEVEAKADDKKKYKELLSTLNVQFQTQNQFYDKLKKEPVSKSKEGAKNILVDYFDQKLNNIHLLKGALESGEPDTVKKTIDSIKIKEELAQAKALNDLNVLLKEEKLNERKTLAPEKAKKKK